VLYARSLKNADFFGKSDPVLYVEIRNGGSGEPWVALGHTGAAENVPMRTRAA
jgi:hypothetical protein